MKRTTTPGLRAARSAALVPAFVSPLFGGLPPRVGAATASTCYVDAARRSDESSGRSPGAAWRGLDRVNATTFTPGDRIPLGAGRSWRGPVPDDGGVDHTGRRHHGPADIGAFEYRA